MIDARVAGVPSPSLSRRSCLMRGSATERAIPVIARINVALVNLRGGVVFFPTVHVFALPD